MKKPIVPILGLCLLTVFVTLIFAETLIVKVQSTNLRKSPKFYAPVVQALKAGDRLKKISAQSGWIQAKTPANVTGWIHSSAVEVKKIDLLASGKSMETQASAGEVALAAKGFNKNVEDAFKSRHGDLSFTWVEKMLKIKIPPAEVEKFIVQGKLGETGGGQ